MAILNTKFKTYFTEFETEMTKAGSAHAEMLASIELAFTQFEIPAEKSAEFITQAHINALATTQGNASQAALNVIAEEKKQDLLDAQIAKTNAEKLLVDAQVTQITKQNLLTTEQIAKIVAETSLIVKKDLTEVQNTLKVIADKEVSTEVLNTQIKATEKTNQEGLKLVRDIQGYDDQMMLKVMDNQSSVASFAVNSDWISAQCTLNDLKVIQEAIITGSGYTVTFPACPQG